MRVLHITTWYPSKNNKFEGIFVKELVNAQMLMIDVLTIVIRFNLNELSYKKTSDSEYQISVKRGGLLNFIKILYFLFFIFKKENIASKIDIINAHSIYCGVIARIISFIFKIKYFITEHSSKIGLKKLNFFESLLLKIAYSGSFRVIAVSEALSSSIYYYYKNIDKIVIISNIINSDIFKYKQINKNGENIKILIVGSCTTIKNHFYFFNSLLHSSNKNKIEVNLIGTGHLFDKYSKYIIDNNLNNIILSGYKDKKLISNLMNEADFLFHPSIYETQSCVIIEALFCGLPVVASNVGAIPEAISDDNGILFELNDIKSLINIIENLDNMRLKFNRLKISNDANLKYDKITLLNKYIEIYNLV